MHRVCQYFAWKLSKFEPGTLRVSESVKTTLWKGFLFISAQVFMMQFDTSNGNALRF